MAIDSSVLMNMMMNNMFYILGILGVLVLVMYVIIISLFMNVSYLKKRYRKMMTGVDDGANLERMLLGHIDEVKEVVKRTAAVEEDNKIIRQLVNKSLHKIGIIRFCAFEDIGSDLSYAVAMLDEGNNGLILSSIFGREESRSYTKPIVNGTSTYTLTDEEKEALQKAMQQ
jgi:hypothetical protein